ncbi:MAG TPA: hypothetical protein EYP35_01385 [Desulfobacterales bacterium]|nr:hypothetical protein [Desulfobacterales bacterium]
MSDLMKEFEQFEKEIDVDDIMRTKDIDYDKYVEALNKYATQQMGLEGNSYVTLKPVYLHGTKIHSLIFNMCVDGRRYSARLIRRVSLGLRDREGERWLSMLKKARDIALDLPPVGLDPKLEELPYWVESNRNCLRMTFRLNESTLVINSTKVVKASGKKEELLKILHTLKERGL